MCKQVGMGGEKVPGVILEKKGSPRKKGKV